jgi:hypothetical protein
MLESPKHPSAGYGIGIAPRGQLLKGAPTGWFLEVGWHGNVGQFRFRGSDLPDGPYQRNGGDDPPTPVEDHVMADSWVSVTFSLNREQVLIQLGGHKVSYPALPEGGTLVIRAWGSVTGYET